MIIKLTKSELIIIINALENIEKEKGVLLSNLIDIWKEEK